MRLCLLLVCLGALATPGSLLGQTNAPADSVFDDSLVTTPPRQVRGSCRMPAGLPPMRNGQPIPGRVVLEMVIDTLGRPEPRTTRVVEGDVAALESYARRMLLTCRYTPAEQDGRKVRARVQAPLEFRYPPP